MKKRIAVLTEDAYLYQKIYLILKDVSELTRSTEGASLVLIDIDTADIPNCEHIRMSRREACELPIPFSADALTMLTMPKKAELTLGIRCAYLREHEIKLTEVEQRLLNCLIDAGGEFIPRDELMERVWQGDADGGVLNVYIHYLREKLEGNGEKIIISSRKAGYKIDEKYLGKKEEQNA